jgi:phosphoribosylformylglycinamidine synthase subunit PurL
VHGHLGGRPPAVDLPRERLLADVLCTAAAERLLDSAHDLSEGGLAQALAECCLYGDAGARIELPAAADPFVTLFSESAGRAVVSVPRSAAAGFAQLCEDRGLPCTRIGVVDLLAPALAVGGQFTTPLRELRAAWAAALPARFG